MRPIKCLWLIDDDPIFVYLTRKMMVELHLAEQIEVFENGQLATDHLHQANSQDLPEIIFLDLMMPVLDGWGFLDEYMEIAESVKTKIKLYVLSSSGSPQDIKRAKKIKEIAGFIKKPMSKANFNEIVGNLETERDKKEDNP